MTKDQDLILGIWMSLWLILILAYLWSNYERTQFFRQVMKELERNKQNDYLLDPEEKEHPIIV